MLTTTLKMFVLPVGAFAIDIKLRSISQKWVTQFLHQDMLRTGQLSNNLLINVNVTELSSKMMIKIHCANMKK